MKSVWLYRAAAFLFVLFAAGHTFGFLTFVPPNIEGRAVWDAMNHVHFQVGRASFSYGGFYVGFGLYVTMYMVFSAFLCWHLSGLARTAPQAIGNLGWIFFAMQLVSLALSWIYFSTGPAVFSGAVAVCLGWAAVAMPARDDQTQQDPGRPGFS